MLEAFYSDLIYPEPPKRNKFEKYIDDETVVEVEGRRGKVIQYKPGNFRGQDVRVLFFGSKEPRWVDPGSVKISLE